MKNRSLSRKMRKVFPVLVAVVIMFAGIKIPYIPSIQFNVQAADVFNTYNLTETELKKIASLCQQEQGTAKGAAAEASLMANRFEMYGSKYSSVYDYARNSGWFAKAGTYMDKMNATDAVVEAVRNVLINGKRTIPGYIDEHDCFSDLKSCTNNGVSITIKDRSQYKQFVTIINNVYGSKYTFYCFPTSSSDPFGYISETKRSQIGEAYYDYDTGELINPNYIPIVTPTISTDKASYNVGNTVYISWAASPSNSNLSHYWLNVIAPDGTYVYGDGMGKNTSYSFVASQSGSYSITTYATPLGSANGEGSLTDSVSISVSQPVWHADLPPADVDSGFYAYIINVTSWNHLTNDNGNVATYPETGAANQIWKFDRREDGSYKITNCADGNVLDVANFGSTSYNNTLRTIRKCNKQTILL